MNHPHKSFWSSLANLGVFAFLSVLLFEFCFSTRTGFFLFLTAITTLAGFMLTCGFSSEFLGLNITCPATLLIWLALSAVIVLFFMRSKGALG